MSEKVSAQLRKTVEWFNRKHPELAPGEILDLVEVIIHTVAEGHSKPVAGDSSMVYITFPNVPWSVSDKDMQELAEVVAEMMYPSHNGKVH